MEKQKDLRDLCQAKHLTAEYLERRIKKVVPGWKLEPLPQKKAYTPEQKRSRLDYCKEAVKRPMDYWKSTVFWDEHTFYRHPRPLPAIRIGSRRRRIVRDKRLKPRAWQHPKLHFAYGVHWKLGVLGPYWISDCKGWKKARKFKVSGGTHL